MKRRDFLCGLSGLAAGLALSEFKNKPITKKSINPSFSEYWTPDGEIKRLHVVTSSHCNFSCKGCATFSTIAKEEFTTYEDFCRDFSILKDLIADKLKYLIFVGGEPTLNPDLAKIIDKAADWFPNSEIAMNTNTFLLDSLGEDFWLAAKKAKLQLIITYYPVNFDRTKMHELIKKYGLKTFEMEIGSDKLYDYTTREVIDQNYNKEGTHHWSKHIVDLDASVDYVERRFNCKHEALTSYARGNIYHCEFHSSINNLRDYFNVDIEITKDDYIKVTNIKDYEQLRKFLIQPKPLCRYCKQCHNICYGSKPEKWEFSKRELSEWVHLNKKSKEDK